jgi:cysteine desulfurase / selenocysteine lyase
MEHHSNMVPWQMLAAERDVRLEFVPVNDDFLFDMDAYRELLKQGPKAGFFTHMSNMLGPSPRPKRSSAWRMKPAR